MKKVLFVMLAWVLVSGMANAQNTTTLIGTVVDESNAVHPNTTVTAVENSTGQKYTATSDERGDYRIVDMQPGTYKVQAAQAGFATLVMSDVQLLVGQTVTLPLTLRIASVATTVEVKSEAQLVNTENQEVGGNINRLQMDEIPLLGRNIQDLALLVPGVTANNTSNSSFGAYRDDLFQVNLDGQQITQGISISTAFGQPVFSRDAISEFQLVTSQFDVSQGRSEGEQVNIITRSGTNDLHGTAYGNFRRDAFDASDFVSHTVLPYAQTIFGGTIGGPIIKDKLHYFFAIEHQSTPSSVFVAPVIYAPNTLTLATPNLQYDMVARGDYTINDKNTLSVRGTFWNQHVTSCACATSYPTSETLSHYYNPNVSATWTNVLTPNVVQEVQAGYYEYFWRETLAPSVAATPSYGFGVITIGPSDFYPENFNERIPSVHYQVSIHHGKHDFKLGAEGLFRTDAGFWPLNARGSLSINVPTDIPLATRFPLADWNNASAWNLSNLGPLVTSVSQDFYPQGAGINMPRHTYAVWAGDTYHVLKNLTINVGVRWDVDLGEYNPPGFTPTTVLVNNGWGTNSNVGIRNGVVSWHDIAPRGGFSWAVGKGFVFRGGAGVFYSVHDSQLTLGLDQQGGQNVFANTYNNPTKNPDFINNWTQGATAATYLANPSLLPPQAFSSVAPDMRDPRAIQATVGIQKQIGSSWVVTSDLIYTKGEFLGESPNVNQNLDPVTGFPLNANYPGAALRPNPAYTSITLIESNLYSEYVALASAVNKRFSKNWQAGLTYTLMFKDNDEGTGSGLGFSSISTINNYACVPCEYAVSPAFQRGTLRANAIYHGPWGLNLSGIFYYGSGNYQAASYSTFATTVDTTPGFLGTDRLNAGKTTLVVPTKYLSRWNGPTSIAPGQSIPRDAFHGLPLYKIDMRLSRDFRFHERIVFTPQVDVFNLLNHPNYGGYNTALNLGSFGNPTQNGSDAYVPREFQFSFHFQF